MPKATKATKKTAPFQPYKMQANADTSPRSSGNWSTEADETLISARASGMSWQPIADKYFPSKTSNACRKRHERLMERRHAEDLDGVKFETIAREYIKVREEMWSILAARVNEKWNIVEAKVSSTASAWPANAC
jgi:hypothetical protein